MSPIRPKFLNCGFDTICNIPLIPYCQICVREGKSFVLLLLQNETILLVADFSMAFKTIANIITFNGTTLEFHYDYVLECEFLKILFMITRVTTSYDPLSYKKYLDNTNIPLQHYNPFADQCHMYRISMRKIKQSFT